MRQILLDEWNPKQEGKATKDKMLNLVKEYVSDPDVHRRLLQCARELVKTRRLRAKTELWEQYALDWVYYCPEETCKDAKTTQTFITRDALRVHGMDIHHIVSDVQAQVHSQDQHSCLFNCAAVFARREDYLDHLTQKHGVDQKIFLHNHGPCFKHVCVWDQCASNGIHLFHEQIHYNNHLSVVHGIKDPQFRTVEKFEEWLDSGRISQKEALNHRESELVRTGTQSRAQTLTAPAPSPARSQINGQAESLVSASVSNGAPPPVSESSRMTTIQSPKAVE